MLGKVFLPLVVLPLLFFAIVGGISLKWYNTVEATYLLKQAKFNRLKDAETRLKSLSSLETKMASVQTQLSNYDGGGVMEDCRRYMSTNAKQEKGIKLNSSTQQGSQP